MLHTQDKLSVIYEVMNRKSRPFILFISTWMRKWDEHTMATNNDTLSNTQTQEKANWL